MLGKFPRFQKAKPSLKIKFFLVHLKTDCKTKESYLKKSEKGNCFCRPPLNLKEQRTFLPLRFKNLKEQEKLIGFCRFPFVVPRANERESRMNSIKEG